MMAYILASSLVSRMSGIGGGDDTDYFYRRPGGTDRYLRPDGTSYYIRP